MTSPASEAAFTRLPGMGSSPAAAARVRLLQGPNVATLLHGQRCGGARGRDGADLLIAGAMVATAFGLRMRRRQEVP